MSKPAILISFDNGEVVWKSVGWGRIPRLMARAKELINQGEDPAEVRELLEREYEVIEDK